MMIIDSVSISNFKSFDETVVKLNNYTVLIGANGSGKSNFFNALKFMSDALDNNIEYAISRQGGLNYLWNVNIKNDKNTKIKIRFIYDEDDINNITRYQKRNRLVEEKALSYELTIEYYSRLTKNMRIKNILEKIEIDYNHINLMKDGKEILGDGTLFIENDGDKIKYYYKNNSVLSLKNLNDELGTEILDILGKRWNKNMGLFAKYISPIGYLVGINSLANLTIFDFDPTRPKRSVQLGNMDKLTRNGDNLAYILEKLLKNVNKREKLFNLISEFLPFIDKYDVLTFDDNSLLTRIQEKYSEDHKFPASFISEGTINITLLIVLLYFEENNYIIIEEPAKRIHPKLVELLTSKMIEVSNKKQVIISTHNPQIVKYAKIDNLLFIRRNDDGNSFIILPKNSMEVKEFLKSDIGLDDLYVNDLLDLR